MGKTWEPPLCVDCKYYEHKSIQPSSKGRVEHVCCRGIKSEKSLVTGKKVRTGHYLGCEEQRSSTSAGACGMSARFFKEK